jgi:hypothetical protein
MALTEQEKERIKEDEKLRLETRKEQMSGRCGTGRMGRFCCGWGGVLMALLVVLVLVAVFCGVRSHHGCYPGYCYDKPAVQGSIATPDSATKK